MNTKPDGGNGKETESAVVSFNKHSKADDGKLFILYIFSRDFIFYSPLRTWSMISLSCRCTWGQNDADFVISWPPQKRVQCAFFRFSLPRSIADTRDLNNIKWKLRCRFLIFLRGQANAKNEYFCLKIYRRCCSPHRAVDKIKPQANECEVSFCRNQSKENEFNDKTQKCCSFSTMTNYCSERIIRNAFVRSVERFQIYSMRRKRIQNNLFTVEFFFDVFRR